MSYESHDTLDAPRARAVLEHIVRSVVEIPEAARVVAVPDGDDIRLDVHVDRVENVYPMIVPGTGVRSVIEDPR